MADRDDGEETVARRRRRSVFVTVGTTLFDPLIAAVSCDDFLRSISKPRCGSYGNVTVQYGKGSRPAVAGGGGGGGGGVEAEKADVTVEEGGGVDYDSVVVHAAGGSDAAAVHFRSYRFKPSLDADMRAADLILSHAGAGSVMEGLALCGAAAAADPDSDFHRRKKKKKKKKLVVVINSRLMDDHQRELADAMEERGYLYVVQDPDLLREEGTLLDIEEFVPAPFPGGNERQFATLLDEHMGFGKGDTDGKKRE